ncbi:hypothetical protein CRG98_045160 [Punica granatum]|uniref:Auxin efflux carrier component n=1 Tax=Punica granatum TaxID=22663 RepID=A0A2I0HSI7_PUNGR|nr:hypothetical protein CRG98_045160 [Punica granatum]
MLLAYVSMKWWKLFTPNQCSGINKFVAKFSIPLLSFQMISSNNPYKMNIKLMFADFLQKMLAVLVLAGVTRFSRRGGLKWIITGLSLLTLPNTLIVGIPLIQAMYGNEAAGLLAQIVVLQSLVWYNVLLFLFELNATKMASATQPPEVTEDTEVPVESLPKEGGEVSKFRSRRIFETLLIVLKVVKKLVRNPNTHATLLGIGGLGMAMFSLGLFMASTASVIACGTRIAAVAMVLKFLGGPALMAMASFPIGLRGSLFKVAIVQATLPLGIVPFVFAKEYNVHPDILSTGVIFGMLIAVPIALGYYLLLAL